MLRTKLLQRYILSLKTVVMKLSSPTRVTSSKTWVVESLKMIGLGCDKDLYISIGRSAWKLCPQRYLNGWRRRRGGNLPKIRSKKYKREDKRRSTRKDEGNDLNITQTLCLLILHIIRIIWSNFQKVASICVCVCECSHFKAKLLKSRL